MKITFRRFYFLNFLSPLLLELSKFPGPNLWVFAKFNNSLPKAETNSKFEVICNRLLYLLITKTNFLNVYFISNQNLL